MATWFLARLRGAGPELRRSLTAACLIVALQGVVGLIQYHTNLPAGVVWVHASLPAALWAVLVWSWLAAGRPATVADPAPSAQPSRATAIAGSRTP